MGQQGCKCECDGDKKNETTSAVNAGRSAYNEDVESKKPTLPAAAAAYSEPATSTPSPVPETKAPVSSKYEPPKTEYKEPPKEEVKAPEPVAPAPKPSEPKPAIPEAKASAKLSGGQKKLCFDLEGNKPLGVRFAEMPEPVETEGALVATSVSETPVSALMWTNKNAMGLCAGDVILSVNGETGGSKKLLELLKDAKDNGGPLELVVKIRPDVFEVTLQKVGDEKMGINVAVHDDINDKVEVRQVMEEGAVPSWNEKNYASQVVIGDWVTAVNGVSKGADEMIKDMQDCWKKKSKLVVQMQAQVSDLLRNSKTRTN